MKSTSILNNFFLLVVAMLLSANLSAQKWEKDWTGEFSRLVVFGRVNVEIAPDGSGKITCSAEGLNTDAVKVTFKGGECVIKVNNLMKKEENFDVKIVLGYNQLEFISVGGGAVVYSNEIVDLANAEIKALSGGQFEAKIMGKNVNIDLMQGAQMTLEGESENLFVNCNTGALLQAKELFVVKADLKANTGGIINIGEVSELKSRANTGGVITYLGEPKIFEVNTKLGGVVQQSN